jgi:hypothetical protein
MRIEEKKEKGIILEIEEDVRIPGTNFILEKGDKIEVFESKKKESDDEEDDEMEDPEEKDDDDDDDDNEMEVEEKKKKGKK